MFIPTIISIIINILCIMGKVDTLYSNCGWILCPICDDHRHDVRVLSTKKTAS